MIRILIVEDDSILRQNIATLLEAENYKTFEAADGKKAVSVLNTLMPDLIISDINMAEMNGFELLEYVRSSQQLKGIPVIFITAKHFEDKKRSEKDADMYLLKPLNLSELLASIEILLNKKRKDPE